MEEKLIKIKSMLYGVNNEVPLSDKEIISVILTFPACLVAAADGNVDQKERLQLMSISEGLGESDVAESDKDRLAAAERYRAFMWLLNEREQCEVFLLDCLKEYYSLHSDTKEQAMEMLQGMAEVSDGVSESEKKEIERLSKALDLNKIIN